MLLHTTIIYAIILVMDKTAKKEATKNTKSELDKFKLFFEHITTEKAPVSHHMRLVKRPRRFGL